MRLTDEHTDRQTDRQTERNLIVNGRPRLHSSMQRGKMAADLLYILLIQHGTISLPKCMDFNIKL